MIKVICTSMSPVCFHPTDNLVAVVHRAEQVNNMKEARFILLLTGPAFPHGANLDLARNEAP
jgi:hypothetical protein